MAVKFQGGKAVPQADPNTAEYTAKIAELRANYRRAQEGINACREDMQALYRIANNMRDVAKGDRLKAAINQAEKESSQAQQVLTGIGVLAAKGA